MKWSQKEIDQWKEEEKKKKKTTLLVSDSV